MPQLDAWHLWMIAGLVLLIAEVFTPGFVVACFGVACLATGAGTALGAGPTLQVLLFIAAGTATYLGVRPFVLKHMDAGPDLKTNVDALAGRPGRVTEAIDPLRERGRALVGGEDWRALSADGAPLAADTPVIVVRVEGTKLIVRPAPPTGDAEGL